MNHKTYRHFDPWRSTSIKETMRETVVEDHHFNVDHVQFDSMDGGPFERMQLHKNNGDSVGVIGLTPEGLIPLVEQYRLPIHRWTLEIPAGHALEKDEQPLRVAQRKLLEEAGYEAEHFSEFARFVNTPSFSDQRTSLFFATGLHKAGDGGQVDVDRSHVRFYTPQEAHDMVLNGTIIDAKSIIAIGRLFASPHFLIESELDHE
ncbi:NUDIX domain-containing protein [Bifidobacterium magnum]|uniref:ADP-ribose pyrophosphatase n=1 Tax=Bifidobacterium magnum TaxID=1692 RepID=A0A087BCK6_9BIFI|nr:NUDIX hydrolase [Bifidobacterium magnum]KFI68756.1 ADP-ribose pyrophosphatase [Bifidobacterium magnum]